MHGVNYIDTADVYTKGASVTHGGHACSKPYAMTERVNHGHYSRSWMLREVDASLGRLQTDYVDILYLHRDYNDMDLEEPMRAPTMALALPLTSPIARGILSGKYAVGQAPNPATRAGRGDKRMTETEFREKSLVIRQRLQVHALAKGCSLTQFATAWVLSNAVVSSVITSLRTLKQWQDYLSALDYVVSAEDEALIDNLVKPGHPSTPGYTDPAYPINGRCVAG